MKVLVADTFDGIAALREAGCEVVSDPELSAESLTAAVRSTGAEVLVVRSTAVPGETLRAGRLGLVVRAGAGVDNIDVATASALAIPVANCPGRNSVAVAELTFALLLAIDRRIPEGVAALRAGEWKKGELSKADGLLGRTFGILGLGGIGEEVARRARAFGMPVVAWSRSLTEGRAEELGIGRLGSPLEVAGAAEVVSVHLPLLPETRGLCDAAFFAALRPRAIFLNTSRAELVDEAALLEAVRGRGLRAGLDVFAGEPAGGSGRVANPLFAESAVYGTHHIGASTAQAQQAIAEEAVRVVREYARTGRAPNVVNVLARTAATHVLVVRHLDRVGVLAHVLGHLREAGINLQQAENVLFEGGSAAIARIELERAPSAELLARIRSGNEAVLGLDVKPVG